MTRFRQALVTGASSGIGTAVCEKLASEGISLILTGRNSGALQELADRLPVDCQILVADLSTEEGMTVVERVVSDRGPDLVINNAGLGYYGEVLSGEGSHQLQMLRVNTEAVMRLTIAAARRLKEEGRGGTILNVSSVAAYQTFPLFATYAASKAFVNVFSESMAYELRLDRINLLVSCPGQVHTSFRDRAAKGEDRGEVAGYVMTPAYAAEQIWWQICSNKGVHIFDWRYRIGTWLSKWVLPKRLVARMLEKSIRGRVH